MATLWKWASFSPNCGHVITDKVFVATALLANMHNVYKDDNDYFQEHIDLLDLTEEQKAEVIEFIFLTTMTIYSKRDFNQMLPKYQHTLKIIKNDKEDLL
jgi:hypothetical protein